MDYQYYLKREQGIGYRLQVTGYRLQGIGYRLQGKINQPLPFPTDN
jgi:hypothetical protein